MKQFTPFPNQDLFLIKWQFVFFVLCAGFGTAIFIITETFGAQASRDLSIAQGELYSARSAVELIEEEEATIIEYIGRFQELSDQGIVQEEDRLLFLERVAELRSEFDLFPISLSIEEQIGMRLQYDPGETEPGGPIDLKKSSVSVRMPLLHEEDLTRFLDKLLKIDGLYQALECSVSQQNRSSTSFLVLAQHLTATCELLWYTFDLSPDQ